MEEKIPKDKNYNSMTFIIDKGSINFIIGCLMSFSMSIIIVQHIGHLNCFPFAFFTIILLGLIYSFGGLGMIVGSNKEPGFILKMPTAIAATVVSAFLFIFPLYFMQTIFLLMSHLLPAYSSQIKPFIPITTNMALALSTLCKPGEVCLFQSNFGSLMGNILDITIIGVGLVVVISLINSVTACLKVMAKDKPQK